MGLIGDLANNVGSAIGQSVDAAKDFGAMTGSILRNGYNSVNSYFGNKGWQLIQDYNRANQINNQHNTITDDEGYSYDRTNIDSYINYMNAKADRAYNSKAIDRTIEALKRNGINPALAFSNSAGSSASINANTSDSRSSSGGWHVKDQVNTAGKAANLLGSVGALIGAAAAFI